MEVLVKYVMVMYLCIELLCGMDKEPKEQQNKEFLDLDNHRLNFEGNCIFGKENPTLSL